MTDTSIRKDSCAPSLHAHWSVFYLMMKSRMIAVWGILLLLVGGELGLVALGMKKILAGDYMGQMYLQRLLEDSGVFWVLILCFALTVLLCASFGLSRGSRSEYTLRRLSVSESTLHLWQAGFALVCFLLLYLFQIPLGYGMAHWYAREMGGIAPDMVGEQTVFLIFWESKLFHFLLPLHDGTLWLSSLVSTVALSLGRPTSPSVGGRERCPS